MSVTVYTTDTCTWCHQVKMYLKMKQQEYKEVNITDDPDSQAKVLAMSGTTRVPVTVVEADGETKIATGYNLGRLAEILAR